MTQHPEGEELRATLRTTFGNDWQHQCFGRATHMLSHSWGMPFTGFINALREAPIAPSLVTCVRTATNAHTHALVAASRHALPAYDSGGGDGLGPRYCPSLHVKVARFPERDSHQVWLEPEGLTTDMVYPNGISGAFEPSVQAALVRTIAGLESATIVRPGYDVEYEFVDPRVLHRTLEVRSCAGLFLAGQIIGTTGYEEVATPSAEMEPPPPPPSATPTPAP